MPLFVLSASLNKTFPSFLLLTHIRFNLILMIIAPVCVTYLRAGISLDIHLILRKNDDDDDDEDDIQD